MIVENKAGAAGTIAAEYLARQSSDGTTLLMAHINSHAIAPALTPKMSYSVDSDFTPVALVGVTPNLLICNEQQQARTVKDVVELCRKNPGKISFGSAGTGSAQHLALEIFRLVAKIDAHPCAVQGFRLHADQSDRRADSLQLRHHDSCHAACEKR